MSERTARRTLEIRALGHFASRRAQDVRGATAQAAMSFFAVETSISGLKGFNIHPFAPQAFAR